MHCFLNSEDLEAFKTVSIRLSLEILFKSKSALEIQDNFHSLF